jgi:hypothetical protein
MERKHFITAAIGASVLVAAAGAALAATPAPYDTSFPSEGGNPCLGTRGNYGGGPRAQGSPDPNAILEHAERNLSRIISTLERDPNDYSGHKGQAIGYLQQALTQLQDALPSAGGNPENPIQSQP